HHGGSHIMLNAGGLVDPASGDAADRPNGVEGGLDLEQELVTDRWSLTAELGGIYFRSPDPHQLNATIGVAWSPSQSIELSLVLLGGLLPGSDRYGVLLGFSPKLALGR